MSHGWFGEMLRFLEPKGPPDQRCWDVIFGCGDEKIRRNQLVGYLRKASSKPVKKHQLDILTIPKCGWVKPEHDQFCCFSSFLDLIYHNDPRFTDSCLPSCFKPRHQNPTAGGNISQNLYKWCNKTMVKTIVSSSFRTYSPQKPLIKHHQKTQKLPAKAQLVRGLCYLNSRGLVHARLDSTTVIFQATGTSLGCGLQGNGFSRVHETRGFYSRTMAIDSIYIYISVYVFLFLK